MPKVNGKKFPYTAKGKIQVKTAKKAAKRASTKKTSGKKRMR